LHAVIQAAFGWENYHLWEFSVGKRRYGLPSDEDWRDEPVADAGKIRLADLIRPRKTRIDYLYDFGDS
jgi:Plasmid pRiA4b ORF-3-like protein